MSKQFSKEEAVNRLKVAIEQAARFGWCKPHPKYGWTMCAADVEKTIMMALGESQFRTTDEPVMTTQELCGWIMNSIWDKERLREKRKRGIGIIPLWAKNG